MTVAAFARTTAANATPTAASGSVTFDVADVGKMPSVPFQAKVIPQQSQYDPDDGTRTGAQWITVTAKSGSGPGGTLTATLGVNNTTAASIKFGYYIVAASHLGPFSETITVPASASDIEVNGWGVTSNPDASSSTITAFSCTLFSTPTANMSGSSASNALMAFAYHNGGNFTQNVLRALGGTVAQNATGTIAEARAVQGLIAVTAGTIAAGIGVDSSWSMSGGVMTNWVAFRSRQGSGTFPGTEYGIVVYGLNLMEKGLTIGSVASAVTNTALRTVMSTTASSGAALGINIASAFIAAANSDVIYGVNVAATLNKGAFTGLVYRGLSSTAPIFSGAGTVAKASALYLEIPTGATANYLIEVGALTAAPAGAVLGSLKIRDVGGGQDGYIEVKALS